MQESKKPITLAPGERLGKNGMPYNFEKWKQKKIESGEWVTKEEWKKRKKLGKPPPPPKINRKRKTMTYQEREKKILKMTSEEDILGRVVIFDTETTGLSKTDEIVEISLIETIEGIKTGRYLHFFVNPDAPITQKAFEIHRLTKEKLESHPKFNMIAHKIAAFIGGSRLLAHNARFDMGMLNRSFQKSGIEPYEADRFICTAKMARCLFPEKDNSQNGLCDRFGIDNFNRVTTGIHSAMEDTVQLYHCFRAMIPLLEKKNICWSNFKLSAS